MSIYNLLTVEMSLGLDQPAEPSTDPLVSLASEIIHLGRGLIVAAAAVVTAAIANRSSGTSRHRYCGSYCSRFRSWDTAPDG